LLLDHDLAPEVRIDLLAGILAGRDLSGIELSEEARGALTIAEVSSRRSSPKREDAPESAGPASPEDGRQSPGAS
jgi:hypothetical protein